MGAIWQTPKTDWDSSQQGIGDGDFNRIEGNTQFLYEYNSYLKEGFLQGSGSLPDNTIGMAMKSFGDGRKLILVPTVDDPFIRCDYLGSSGIQIGGQNAETISAAVPSFAVDESTAIAGTVQAQTLIGGNDSITSYGAKMWSIGVGGLEIKFYPNGNPLEQFVDVYQVCFDLFDDTP